MEGRHANHGTYIKDRRKPYKKSFISRAIKKKKLGMDVTTNFDRGRVNELEVQIKFIKFSTLQTLEIQFLTDFNIRKTHNVLTLYRAIKKKIRYGCHNELR
ncbi:hypothetical protein ACOME3_001001 [Neoechinorhynchus agilis]